MARRGSVARLVLLAGPLAGALFGMSLFFGIAPASAHATLEHTVPAANAHLATEPRRVVLVFDQPVSLALGNATVVGPDGAQVSTGYTSSDGGNTVTIALRPGVGPGAYVVSYRVVSVDTHPVAGGFYFQVGHGSAAATTAHHGSRAPPPTSGSAPENTTVRAVYAACRYAGFVGLLLLIGGTVFLLALLPAGVADRRVVRLVWLGYGLTAAGSMGELVLQVPYAAGTTLTGITGVAFDSVVGTRFGTAHLVRLGLLALAAPVLAASSARPRWATVCAVPLGVGLLVTWAYSGHAGTTVPVLSVPSDVVHLAAMSVWIGGLVVLATAVLPSGGTAGLHETLPRWSRVAMGCVAALIASGTAQSLVEVSGWSGLTRTTYGQLLLAKIGLLAVVLVVANFSRRWVRHRCVLPAVRAAAGQPPGLPPAPSRAEVGRLRRGVAFESVVAAAAVAVAAVLIEAAPGSAAPATSPGTIATARPITRHGAYRATIRKGAVIIHIKVDPAVVGIQYIYLAAKRPDGRRMRVRKWTLTVSNDRLGLDQVNVPVLLDNGVGHHFAYGSFSMPRGGTWTVSATARTSAVDETIVSCRVRVRS